jgi:hypothetical protein
MNNTIYGRVGHRFKGKWRIPPVRRGERVVVSPRMQPRRGTPGRVLVLVLRLRLASRLCRELLFPRLHRHKFRDAGTIRLFTLGIVLDGGIGHNRRQEQNADQKNSSHSPPCLFLGRKNATPVPLAAHFVTHHSSSHSDKKMQEITSARRAPLMTGQSVQVICRIYRHAASRAPSFLPPNGKITTMGK